MWFTRKFSKKRCNMNVSEITSRDNPLVKHIKMLNRSGEYRKETGEFAAEGEKLFAEAILSGISVTTVLTTPIGINRLQSEISSLSERGAHIIVTNDYVIEAVSELKSSPDIIFTAKMPKWDFLNFSGDRFIVLDALQNPGNVGTIMRCADAFGIDGILFVGQCVDMFAPKTVRAAMGSVFRIPAAAITVFELDEFINKNGFKLYGSSLSETSRDMNDISFDRCAVVIGNEGSGISNEILAICSGLFRIPMKGKAQSLNAAAAAAIIIWEMTK